MAALVKAVKKTGDRKIRKGFDESRVNAVEVAKILEGRGGRGHRRPWKNPGTVLFRKSGLEIIRRVKEAVGIPVFGNGDVDSPQRAAAMLRETGCDGIMIGRGAQGNPWIFSRVLRYLEEGEILPPPGRQEVKEMIFRHMEMLIRGEGRIYRNPGDAQACGLVHRGISPFRQAQGQDQHCREPGGDEKSPGRAVIRGDFKARGNGPRALKLCLDNPRAQAYNTIIVKMRESIPRTK